MKNIINDEKFKLPELYFIAKLPIELGKDILLISLSAIRYMESDGNYTKIYTADKDASFHSSKNLKFYEVNLPAHSFIRVHNRFIVNVNYIKFIKRDHHWKLELHNGTQLNVSDEKKEILLQKLGLKYDSSDCNAEIYNP